jgi:hypothetical protein
VGISSTFFRPADRDQQLDRCDTTAVICAHPTYYHTTSYIPGRFWDYADEIEDRKKSINIFLFALFSSPLSSPLSTGKIIPPVEWDNKPPSIRTAPPPPPSPFPSPPHHASPAADGEFKIETNGYRVYTIRLYTHTHRSPMYIAYQHLTHLYIYTHQRPLCRIVYFDCRFSYLLTYIHTYLPTLSRMNRTPSKETTK